MSDKRTAAAQAAVCDGLMELGCSMRYVGTAALLCCASALAELALSGKPWQPSDAAQAYAQARGYNYPAVWQQMRRALRCAGCRLTVGNALRWLVHRAVREVQSNEAD